MNDAEEWRAVPDYDGLYEVSDLGRVRSLPRQTARGVRGGRELKLLPDRRGYLYVALSREGSVSRGYVHKMVLQAFAGLSTPDMEVAHEDGDVANNRLVNLSYKTKSGNVLDSVRHGTHRNAKKICCPRCGSSYRVNGRGQRVCRPCINRRRREQYAEDPERVLDRQKARRAEDPDRVRAVERASKSKSRAKSGKVAVA